MRHQEANYKEDIKTNKNKTKQTQPLCQISTSIRLKMVDEQKKCSC